MWIFLLRFVFYLVVGRLVLGLLRATGLLAPRRAPPGAPEVPRPSTPSHKLGGDIVDAEFEDLSGKGGA